MSTRKPPKKVDQEGKPRSKIVYRVVDEATEDKPDGIAAVVEWLEGLLKNKAVK